MTEFYSPARRPHDEEDRQRAVDESGFFDAAGDPELAAIIREAAALFGAPMAAISIADGDRQWFPVELGIGVKEMSRAAAFCAHTILDVDHPTCVADTAADGRFAGNPLVLSGPLIRFYVGTPLIGADGQPLGALCVLKPDRAAPANDAQARALANLARRAVARARKLRPAPQTN